MVGGVCFMRHFNRPTGLTSRTRVALRFDRFDRPADVTLNDAPLGSVPVGEGTTRLDVTRSLQLHNRLEIVVAAAEHADEPPGDVALVIDEGGDI